MTDTPAARLAAAVVALKGFCDFDGLDEAQQAFDDGIKSVIAAAREAEREACAEVCESYKWGPRKPEHTGYDRGFDRAVLLVAAAIRARKEGEG